MFCSDNGPVLDDGDKDGAVEKLGNHQPAGPFSGGKYSVLEGGTHTPFITLRPGHISLGVSDEIVCTIDLAASLAAMTGVKLPFDACLDRFDVHGALLGDSGAKGREHLLQQDNGSGKFGFRTGSWKLQRAPRGAASKVKKQAGLPDAPKLFDLTKDPGESTDVAAQHPEITKRLNQELEQIIAAGRSRPAR